MGRRSKYAIAANHTFVLLNLVRHKSDQIYCMTFEIIPQPPLKVHSEEPKCYKKTIRKICQFSRPPVPTVAIFFNVAAYILLQVTLICFWDTAHHNNDGKIKVLNALIWDSQDLSFHPRTTYTKFYFDHKHVYECAAM